MGIYSDRKRKMDDEYEKRLAHYKEHVEKLRLEKVAFIKENPDFPNPDILFLNVMAPPQRIIFTEIV